MSEQSEPEDDHDMTDIETATADVADVEAVDRG